VGDIADGETTWVQGSGKDPYELKNVGGVYSCSCPAWRNAGGPIDRRTCKHLKALRGADVELARVGAPPEARAARPGRATGEEAAEGAPVLLAHAWEPHQDPTGWWMSEKLDGVRAYWDGRRFLSRLGNTFFAPDWFVAGLPETPLDGELWVGRKRFQDTVSVVRRADGGPQWRQLKYVVFDAPEVAGPFEERVGWLHAVAGSHPSVQVVAHRACEGVDDLRAELARVEALGGEGLMLRQPGSAYVVGRSTTLLKVKTFHDAEGRVVGHEPGKGKHTGRLGALVVEMADGTRFNVGTGFTDDDRRSPPPVDSLVTYRFQELSRDGVPRFPTYVGLAVDKAGPTR
jgi:DNA ligase-1